MGGRVALDALERYMIRVSAAALCRIEIDGGLLLGLNRNRQKKGVSVLTPIGGVVEVEDREVLKSLRPLWEGELSCDLRLSISCLDLWAFERWWLATDLLDLKMRNALRELDEELVLEYEAVDTVAGMSLTWWSAARRFERSSRFGLEGRLTRRYSEIFQVSIVPERLTTLKESCARRSDLRIVSEREILQGRSDDGIAIASSAKDLIRTGCR
jgi:hypothetical protein